MMFCDGQTMVLNRIIDFCHTTISNPYQKASGEP